MPKNTDVVQQHFRHSLGLTVRFGGADSDGDGIQDKKDACPDVPGLEEFNGCPDTDGDGIQDSEDVCPDTAGLAEFKGCPDTDGDGISDNNDSCPNVAGLADMGGCPDSDGDGITDKRDGCPTEAGPRGNRGCPWPDADGDSVVDKDDNCPNEAGTVANGGCPEAPSEAVQDKLASYAKTINFDYGKASIKDEANKTLQAIVEILVQYPNANFVVEGHTDSVGSKGFNQKLSEERAASIVEFLTSNGVDAARLSSVGFGETSPVASNDTKEGMAQNRRVEVKLAN
jgi:outer membrane protein OmpA-like peptidoglycan-associated protein